MHLCVCGTTFANTDVADLYGFSYSSAAKSAENMQIDFADAELLN